MPDLVAIQHLQHCDDKCVIEDSDLIFGLVIICTVKDEGGRAQRFM